LTKENYNEKGGRRVERRAIDPSIGSVENENESNYHGDNDETDLETYGTDSISALSVSDMEFSSRKEKFNQARRKALDNAIKRGDWDLVESAAQDFRRKKEMVSSNVGTSKEWTQSELDKFISENDWDAVAKYIAHMRDNNVPREERMPRETEGSKQGNVGQRPMRNQERFEKRFGARSQLQHKELASVSSWDTDSFYDSDDYSSSSSVSYGHGMRKEFVC